MIYKYSSAFCTFGWRTILFDEKQKHQQFSIAKASGSIRVHFHPINCNEYADKILQIISQMHLKWEEPFEFSLICLAKLKQNT